MQSTAFLQKSRHFCKNHGILAK